MTSNTSEYENEDEDSLNVEEIAALLDIEYQKHVEKSSPNFFLNNHGEQFYGSVHSQGALHEGNDNLQESYSEDEIELHTVYEQEEVSGDNEDISLVDEMSDDLD